LISSNYALAQAPSNASALRVVESDQPVMPSAFAVVVCPRPSNGGAVVNIPEVMPNPLAPGGQALSSSHSTRSSEAKAANSKRADTGQMLESQETAVACQHGRAGEH
jgi:hypothetical protein